MEIGLRVSRIEEKKRMKELALNSRLTAKDVKVLSDKVDEDIRKHAEALLNQRPKAE